jgi:AraC-like DNA-binding protein
MSFRRQPPLSPNDERFLIVRTMVVQCSPGLRTSSPTKGWHRLVAAASGVLIVRTPQGAWSTPTSNAVWVPEGVRCDLEMCGQTALRMLYIRPAKQWHLPSACGVVTVSPLLRELIGRISTLSALDRRVAWHAALRQLLVHEVRHGAHAPHELIWPTDPRVARVASQLQAHPDDCRRLRELCRGQGISARTVQRLFPLQTGQTFEGWRLRLRFLHAIRLLADGRKVCSAALECGYQSPSAFVAAFRRFAGVTPREFCRGNGQLKSRPWSL